ncbi:MAG: hypothetical protein KBT72_08665 [Zhongshania sp.]|nr:hypothetical protein [Zhongshania sp.]
MAEKSEAQQAWSDGAECAYDYMAIAITAKGEVWANKEIVGVSGVRSAIELAKKSRNIVCIIVLADAGVDKESELVEKVLEAVHEKHGKKVYFISESEH